MANLTVEIDDNSSDVNHNMYERHIPVLAVVIIEVVILFVSLIGNAIVILIVVKKRRMQSFTNWLILNLAVADVYTVLICIPLEIPLELNTSSSPWPYGKFFCRIYYPMQTASIYGSVFTLVALSISRWWAVIHPFRRQPTVNFAKILIAVIWFCSFAVVVPYIMVLEYNPDKAECSEVWEDEERRRRYTLAIFIFQYVFPLCIISVAYVWITVDLSLSSKETALPKDKRKRIETKKVVKLLLVVTVTFAASILPYHLVAIFSEFGHASEFRYIQDISSMAYVILYLNAALNPILYNVFNSNFREAFIELYVTIKTYVLGSKNDLSGKGFFSSRRPSVFDNRRMSRTSTARSQSDSFGEQRQDAALKHKFLRPENSANSYSFSLNEKKSRDKCLAEDATKLLLKKNENNNNNNN